MAITFTKKKGVAQIHTETKNGGVTVLEGAASESVDAPGTAPAGASEPWCEVGFEASYTHNLGNYQSLRVGVSLKLPSLPGEINDTFEYAKQWVDARMNSVMEELPEANTGE